jgi:putative DNA methylase
VENDRRLIEDYLPIKEISKESSCEKSIRKGHISTLHLWWARRPLVACRAAVYGALVPAPAAKNGRGPKSDFVKRLCKYPGDPAVIKQAQQHILEAHAERLSKELGKTVPAKDIEEGRAPRPRVLDMFAGGGAIPLEALRLGCEAYALELNPVAHLIELCTLVYPQKYGKTDKNSKGSAPDGTWAGLANEVEFWGKWVLENVKEEISDLYPPIRVHRSVIERGRQERIEGKAEDFLTLTPMAYLWTRTVKCKNPHCRANVPLLKQTWVHRKEKRFVAIKLKLNYENKTISYSIVEAEEEKHIGFDPNEGSKAGNAICLFCGTVADDDYVKDEGCNGRMDKDLMAVVCTNKNKKGKVFLGKNDLSDISLYNNQEINNRIINISEKYNISTPSEPILTDGKRSVWIDLYGLKKFSDIFNNRQLLVHLTFAKSIRQIYQEMKKLSYNEPKIIAICDCLAMAIDRHINQNNTLAIYNNQRDTIEGAVNDKTMPMAWDFPESNPFSDSSGNFLNALDWVINVIQELSNGFQKSATVNRGTALSLPIESSSYDAVVTDPPYYDNISYAILSDFFYCWLKRSIGFIHLDNFASEGTPKKNEIVSDSLRHEGNKNIARAAYESMMAEAFIEARRVLKTNSPLVCVYAHKTTMGWATLIEALRKAGFVVAEAWPIETERKGGRKKEKAVLASSIFLVARRRENNEAGSYDAVKPELESIVRERVETLWKEGISGADLVIAAVGAGLRAFTRYAKVEYQNGEEVPAEKFLTEVEGTVLETLLEKIFNVPRSGVAGVDAATRFYVLWRFTYKYAEIDAGEAIVFAYPQDVELDGPKGLSTGVNSLLEKKKNKFRPRDFAERGNIEALGISDNGTPAPLIDVLHKILWLMENQPLKINEFLEKVTPPVERLRLVAQALKGHTLGGSAEEISAPEQTALGKLLANWRSVIEEGLIIKRETESKVIKQMRLEVE